MRSTRAAARLPGLLPAARASRRGPPSPGPRARPAVRPPSNMSVAVCVFELHIPQSRGLKEKRKVVKGLVERTHARFKVSIAETDYHDLHQRAEISLALVAQREDEAERMLDAIRGLIDSEPECWLSSWDPQILDWTS